MYFHFPNPNNFIALGNDHQWLITSQKKVNINSIYHLSGCKFATQLREYFFLNKENQYEAYQASRLVCPIKLFK